MPDCVVFAVVFVMLFAWRPDQTWDYRMVLHPLAIEGRKRVMIIEHVESIAKTRSLISARLVYALHALHVDKEWQRCQTRAAMQPIIEARGCRVQTHWLVIVWLLRFVICFLVRRLALSFMLNRLGEYSWCILMRRKGSQVAMVTVSQWCVLVCMF